MLIDSNIVIYAALPEHAFLDAWLDKPRTAFSVITRIEILGYAQLANLQRKFFENLFSVSAILPLDDAVTDICIPLRRAHAIKLADAIIAATALAHNLPLLTRNIDDFQRIEGLQVVNPFSA